MAKITFTDAGWQRKWTTYRRLWRPRLRNFKLKILRLFLRFVPKESQRVFALTLIVGALCGLAAVAFHLAIIKAESLLIDSALAAPGNNWIWLTVLTPTLGGLLSGILLAYVVPGARGSGIPQVKVAYEIKGGRLPFRDSIGKFFGTRKQRNRRVRARRNGRGFRRNYQSADNFGADNF